MASTERLLAYDTPPRTLGEESPEDLRPSTSPPITRAHTPSEFPQSLPPDIESPPGSPFDVNIMKRNMSIAKGFMDVSLLMANTNQLRHLINFGNPSNVTYHIIMISVCLSIVLQIVTGVMLIVKERFDLTLEEDRESAELYNNIVVLLVFITLLVNVFISGFGVDVLKPET